MDFGALPPEVNSGRMYAGPGPGQMLAAAAAWSRLAAELSSAASGYESAIADLTGQEWLGPAAQSMAAAAGPYVAWLSAAAGQAERTAVGLTAAVSAFEEAYAAVVPPPVIAANRSQLASLVATDVVGQNAAAIAAAEAHYSEMWMQDAAAMYGYAARSAAAATLTPLPAPPSTTNPAGTAAQTGSVAQAGAGGAHSQLSQLLTAIPQALREAGGTVGSPAPLGDLAAPAQNPPELPSFTQAVSYVGMTTRSILPANDTNISILYGQGQFARNLNTDLDIAAANAAANAAAARFPANALSPIGFPGLGSGLPPAVSASAGNAGTVGKLAVPPGWGEAAPPVAMTATALPGTGVSAAPASATGSPADLYADMAVAGLAGTAIAGGAAGRGAAQTKAEERSRLERLAGELTGTREVRHWHADPSREDNVFAKLSRQPGVHTVHLKPDDQAEPQSGPQPG